MSARLMHKPTYGSTNAVPQDRTYDRPCSTLAAPMDTCNDRL